MAKGRVKPIRRAEWKWWKGVKMFRRAEWKWLQGWRKSVGNNLWLEVADNDLEALLATVQPNQLNMTGGKHQPWQKNTNIIWDKTFSNKIIQKNPGDSKTTSPPDVNAIYVIFTSLIGCCRLNFRNNSTIVLNIGCPWNHYCSNQINQWLCIASWYQKPNSPRRPGSTQ